MQNRYHSIPRIPVEVNLDHIDPTILTLINQSGKNFKTFAYGNSHIVKYYGLKADKALGSNTKTIVSLCQDKTTGTWFAFKAQTKKIFECDNQKFTNKKELENELAILHSLNQTVNDPTTNQPLQFQKFSTKKNEHRFYFPMQLAHGKGLHNYLYAFTHIPQVKHPIIYFDMVLGMIDEVKILHEQHWVHRDIKPSNFVYDDLTNKTKLIDMASLLSLKKDKKILKQVSAPFYGTNKYTEQGILKNKDNHKKSAYSKGTDIYSLAISIKQVLNLKRQSHIISDPKQREEINIFLHKMCNIPKNKRPTIQEVKDFFEKIFSKVLETAPKMKVGLLSISIYQYLLDNCTTQEQNHFWELLKSYNKIVLLEGSNMNLSTEYAKVIHGFETYNISVVPIVFEVHDQNTIHQFVQDTLQHQSRIFRDFVCENIQATTIPNNTVLAAATVSTNTATEFYVSTNSYRAVNSKLPASDSHVNPLVDTICMDPMQIQPDDGGINTQDQLAAQLLFAPNNSYITDFGLFPAKRRKLNNPNNNNDDINDNEALKM